MDLQFVLSKGFYTLGKPRVLAAMRELDAQQWLGHTEQEAMQRQQIQNLLEYVYKYVPYYQDLFRALNFHPSDYAADPASFARIPLLTKSQVQQNQERLITTEPQRNRGLYKVKTGGTTGEPMWLRQDQVYHDYNTAHVYQEMTWAGWQIGRPQVWLWGHSVLAPAAVSRTAAARDWISRRFESNAFNMDDASMETLACYLERHPDSELWSYVSTLYRFAQFLAQRSRPVHVHAAHTAAEPLYDHQRQFIQNTLSCPVFNSYSCVEIGSIAAECEQHAGLHLRTRNCYVEIVQPDPERPEGTLAAEGDAGEVVLTTLTNYAFPLIRYRIEDWGRKSSRACSCGRGLPMLEVVEGRVIDHFKTADGRQVWGAFLTPMVPLLGQIQQYQIVQEAVDLLIFRVIPAGPIHEEKFEDIRQAVKTVLGETVQARLEFVEELPATPTGKHRYTVCKV